MYRLGIHVTTQVDLPSWHFSKYFCILSVCYLLSCNLFKHPSKPLLCIHVKPPYRFSYQGSSWYWDSCWKYPFPTGSEIVILPAVQKGFLELLVYVRLQSYTLSTGERKARHVSKSRRGLEQTTTPEDLWLKPGWILSLDHVFLQVKRLVASVINAFYIKLVELQEYDLITSCKWAAAYKYEAVLSC